MSNLKQETETLLEERKAIKLETQILFGRMTIRSEAKALTNEASKLKLYAEKLAPFQQRGMVIL